MIVRRSIAEPLRTGLTQEERWKREDGGLIACWERGREMALSEPALAAAAQAGELVPLPWKGGVEIALKSKKKTGAYFYLAMWQGLRGHDLSIDTESQLSLTCARFGVTVTFTGKFEDYANA